jgi:PTS system mannose-specific IIA component
MRIVIVSHDELAEGMLRAAEMIAGEAEGVAAFGLKPGEDGEILTKRILDWLGDDPDPEVLVLSDLYFGSPFNALVSLSQVVRLYHVTGMNLAMVIQAISLKDEGMSAAEVAAQIIPLAHEGIVDVNEVLKNM